MVRREIKKFEMEYKEAKYQCEAPFSLHTVLSASDICVDKLKSNVTFTSDIELDSVALAIKHIMLRFRGIEAPCEVLLNGESIGSLDGERLVYTLEVRDKMKLGTNKLSVRFSSDKCDDALRIGIFAPVELIRCNNAIIDRVSLSQKHEGGTVTVGIKLDLLGSVDNVRAVATLVSSAGQIYYAGLTRGRGSIVVRDPLYWWPHGYGVQNLYRVTVNLYGDTEIEDTVEMKIGLRTLVTSKNADGALVEVNGIPILSMGAVYNVDKNPLAKSGDKKLDAYITSAAMANYNTLIIPGNSRRPTERFYDLCDMHGIMVVEEFEKLSDSILDTLERTSHHPSLALIDVVGGEQKLDLWLEGINAAVPELDFSVLDQTPVYVSYPSMPTDKTLFERIPKGERNLHSRSVESLAKGGEIKEMFAAISERFSYPSTLSDFAYASRLAAAGIIEEKIKELRLAKGKLGRAVFSEIGDMDVIISSSAIDSQARWKTLQYASQRFFAPIALYAEVKDGKIAFSVSNENRFDFSGTLEYRIADSKNITIFKNTEPCEFDALTSKKLFERELPEHISEHEDEYYLEYFLRDGASIISRKVELFVPEKHFRFDPPEIEAEIAGSDRRFSMTLTSKNFARGVELEFDGIDAVFSDNYFDITSQSPMKITFNVIGGIETAYHLSDALKIRTSYDLKRDFDN